jgi:hypothetical protein
MLLALAYTTLQSTSLAGFDRHGRAIAAVNLLGGGLLPLVPGMRDAQPSR